MGFHTYDVERADALEDPERYERLGADELLDMLRTGGRVLDVGSGTGFYTDDVAGRADTVVALDVQPAMHAIYLDKGVPGNVQLVTGEAGALPFARDAFDGVVSTMTFHEFATPSACEELARVLVPGGVVAIADWSRAGPGEDGPPRAERYDLGDAHACLAEAGLAVTRAEDRGELFRVRALNRPA